MKLRVIAIGITITIVLAGFVIACSCLTILSRYANPNSATETTEVPTCPELPDSFSESDLIGTWTGRYFGNVDKLIIRTDGTYKQIYSAEGLNFESNWETWYIEYDPQGYARLHLTGMRRCDGLDSVCNDPRGGLPNGEQALNPCESEPLSFEDEVILFIIGTTSDVPRGILLLQAKIGGSEWTYTFRLDQ